MNVQKTPKQRKSDRGKSRVKRKTERLEELPLQERFGGKIPLRGERPAEEVLRERLDEAVAGSIPQIFVP